MVLYVGLWFCPITSSDVCFWSAAVDISCLFPCLQHHRHRYHNPLTHHHHHPHHHNHPRRRCRHRRGGGCCCCRYHYHKHTWCQIVNIIDSSRNHWIRRPNLSFATGGKLKVHRVGDFLGAAGTQLPDTNGTLLRYPSNGWNLVLPVIGTFDTQWFLYFLGFTEGWILGG